MAARHRKHATMPGPHRYDHGGSAHSPEAIRQMGAAIRAAAARSGARINPDDPALHQAIAGFIGADGMQRLAAGDAAVIGLVDRFVEQHAATIAQHQKQHEARGLAQADGASLGAGESLAERLQRTGAYGPFALKGAAEGGSTSSARFNKGDLPLASIPGNADMHGFDIKNYYTSPLTRALVDMGMNDKTFDHLRQQGFGKRNIENAGRDARSLGFSANDKAAVRDHAIIDKHDPKARQTNKALKDYQERLDNDPVLAELMGKRKSAANPEERKALDKQIQARRLEHRKGSGVQGRIDDKSNPKESRDATGRRADEVDKLYEKNRGVGVQPGAATSDGKLTQGRQKTEAAPALDATTKTAKATPESSASRFRAQAQKPNSAAAAPTK